MLTLLRLLDLRSGVISIDGLDISTLPRELIRLKITTIPQDSFFPPTHSLRRTLVGTTTSLSDLELLVALENVGLLQHAVSQLAKTGDGKGSTTSSAVRMVPQVSTRILDAKMAALPLSAGQQQLFCLARALLQENKIVILDEVTSAMDAATEEMLRKVLAEGLKGRTVLMVAHRAAMLDICDVVVEVDGGRVVNVSRRRDAMLHNSGSIGGSDTV